MERIKWKLAFCIRSAKADSLNYRETKDKRFLQLRKEGMQDARYWKSQLTT
jgi:hypothetical protein